MEISINRRSSGFRGVKASPHRSVPKEPGLSLFRGVVVLVVFALLMLGVTETMKRVELEVLLGEQGVIELTQLGLLAAIYWNLRAAATMDGSGSLFVLLSRLLIIAIIRELDGMLDLVWHGFWKVPALLVAAVAIRGASLHWEQIRQGMVPFLRSSSAGISLTASAVVLVQSRMLGRQSVWRDVLDADYVRIVPRLVEETSELAGYALMAWGAIEVRRWVAHRHRQSSLESSIDGKAPV